VVAVEEVIIRTWEYLLMEDLVVEQDVTLQVKEQEEHQPQAKALREVQPEGFTQRITVAVVEEGQELPEGTGVLILRPQVGQVMVVTDFNILFQVQLLGMLAVEVERDIILQTR